MIYQPVRAAVSFVAVRQLRLAILVLFMTVPSILAPSSAMAAGGWATTGVTSNTTENSSPQVSVASLASVTFTDPNLEAVVRTTLGIPRPLPVAEADMLRLTTLNAGSMGITNLGGLEFATNLRDVYLLYNDISDVAPLAGLTNLDSLTLGYNQITNISPLASLTGLSTLYLADNRISDVSPLAGLTNLTDLHIGYNDVSDITPLAGLTNLTSLGLGGNQISNITALAGMTKLSYLSLYENRLSDVSPLAGLSNLTQLMLNGNQISDISPLAGLTNLTGYLYLQDNHISDISPLSGMTRLEWLHLRNNQVTNLAPLAGLASLTKLDLAHNAAISDISPLAGLTGLSQLFLDENLALSDIAPLAPLKNLTVLGLQYNQISDLRPLSGLTALTNLQLVGNRISDLSPLSELKGLQRLALGHAGMGNQVSDLSPLSGLTNLQALFLDENSVDDLSPLAHLTQLNTVTLENNEVSDISPLVANSGLGSGDEILLRGNYLDVGSDPQDKADVDALVARGVYVDYALQRSPNTAPVANSGTVTTNQSVAVQATLSAMDADGDTLTYSIVSGPLHGSLGAVSGSKVTYTPSGGYTGIDSFSFKVNDGEADSAPATVTVTIRPAVLPSGTSAAIPTGTDVTVNAGDVAATFPNVSVAGTLTVTPYQPRREGPTNFRLLTNAYFDIHPTATFAGIATLTLLLPVDYAGDLTKLKVFHWKDNGWETLPCTVDVSARTVTFQTDSFSDFAVGEPVDATPVVSTPASSTWSMLLFSGIVLGAVAVIGRRLA